jgi:hypothetical protein
LNSFLSTVVFFGVRSVSVAQLDWVGRLVDDEDWVVGEVEEGIAGAERGELVEHEEIGRMIERRSRLMQIRWTEEAAGTWAD